MDKQIHSELAILLTCYIGWSDVALLLLKSIILMMFFLGHWSRVQDIVGV